MTVKERVREHRNKLKQQDCRRLEVWQGVTLIEQVRQIARGKEESMASAVQEALEAYVAAHAAADPQEDEYQALMAEDRRLKDERTRLSAQVDSLQWRHEIQEYNRKLADFNQRVVRFKQSQTSEH